MNFSARSLVSLSALLLSVGVVSTFAACSDSATATDTNTSTTADASADSSDDAASSTDSSAVADSSTEADASISDASTDTGALITDAAACEDNNPCTVDSLADGACVHTVATGGTTCRPAAGACDVEEKCDGTTTVCPADGVAANTVVCRAAANVCDAEEKCDGTSKACGADQKKTPYAVGATGSSSVSNLYSINADTGATVATIGAIGRALTGLAQHPKTGVLYGVTTPQSPVEPQSLITIDLATGAGTLVASTGKTIADISFDSMGNLYGWSESSDDLVSINLVTAVATEVADSGLDTYGSGLAFDNAGTLFYAGSGVGDLLRTVSTTTGLSTDLPLMTGFEMGTSGNSIRALAVHPNTDVLYGVQGANNSSPTSIFTIDKATSAVVTKGASINGLDAFAFVCTP